MKYTTIQNRCMYVIKICMSASVSLNSILFTPYRVACNIHVLCTITVHLSLVVRRLVFTCTLKWRLQKLLKLQYTNLVHFRITVFPLQGLLMRWTCLFVSVMLFNHLSTNYMSKVWYTSSISMRYPCNVLECLRNDMSSEWIQTSFQFTVQVNIRIVSLYCRQHCSVMCCSKQTLVQGCFNIKLNYTLKTNQNYDLYLYMMLLFWIWNLQTLMTYYFPRSTASLICFTYIYACLQSYVFVLWYINLRRENQTVAQTEYNTKGGNIVKVDNVRKFEHLRSLLLHCGNI